MSLQCLPKSTIKLIGSAQVITSVSAAVKELIENSLDAGALSIDVKLENHGLDKIEVRDDGCGISEDDVPLMCRKSYTSKITCFSDLDELHSYGFRGEALNALCAVSKLTVTTKTEQDELAYSYQFDNDGSVKDKKASHINKGTIIMSEGLFRNLPVRRQFLTNGRRRSDEIKKVESAVKSLAIIHPRVRFTLTHNKFLIWQKNSVHNLKQSLAQAIPPTIISQLDSFNFQDSATNIEMDVLLPRKDCNISVTCFSNRDDSFYIFINSRPVKHKQLEKTLESELFQYFGHHIPTSKYPLCLLSINLPPDGLDVNLEPNKTRVVVKDLDYLLEKIKSQFVKYYAGVQESVDAKTPVDIKLPKRKLEVDNNADITSQNNAKVFKSDSDNFNLLNCDNDIIDQIVPVETVSDGVCTSENFNFTNKIEATILKSTLNTKEDESFSECSHVSDKCKISQNDDYSDSFSISSHSQSTQDIKLENKRCNEKYIENMFDSSENEFYETLKSQEIDEIELMLAGSQSSIVVTPELHSSLDCFESSQNSSESLKNINVKSVNESSINQTKSGNSCEREENIGEFLNGLPLTNSNDGLDSYDSVNHKKTKYEEQKHLKDVDSIELATNPGKNDLDSFTLSQWSKGHVLDTIDAPVIVEPGGHLTNNNINSDTDNFPMNEFKPEKTSMDRSVSSQMGCKNMSGFTTFAKDMRTKIIDQQPGISFTRVASDLATKWKELADDQKKYYEDLSKKEKIEGKNKKVETAEPKLKQTTIQSKAAVPAKGLQKVKYGKVIGVEVSMNTIRNKKETSSFNEKKLPHLIGKLSDDLYCFIQEDGRLSVLSAPRLNEVITYYQNMSTMTVPLKVLEKNIPVITEDVGEKNWLTLQCLETSLDFKNNTIVIDNELITKNGFRIEVIEGMAGKQFEITDVPTHIAYYGVEDLKEILEFIDEHGTSGSLVNCRPLKIASYIRSETVRACSDICFNFENKGRDSMFNFWIKNIQTNFPNCPHHKRISKELYKINDKLD